MLSLSTRRPSSAPARSVALNLERLEAREVLSLTPISAGAGYPFTTIVELKSTFPDHKTFVGTGVMVDRFHVLTAGHVVYDYQEGGWASQVVATPELNGKSEPFGEARMTYERSYTGWTNYSKAHPGGTAPGDYDIGLITLDRTLGDRTGWMSYGYDNNNADFAKGAILNTAGYPAAGGYDGTHMEFSEGGIAGLSSDGSALQYYQSSITTYGGQSGSPVWRYTPNNNARVVYGIHVGGSGKSDSLNFATRITQGIFNDLQNWRKADPLPGSGTTHTSMASAVGSVLSSLRLPGFGFGLQDGDGGAGAAAGGEGSGPASDAAPVSAGEAGTPATAPAATRTADASATETGADLAASDRAPSAGLFGTDARGWAVVADGHWAAWDAAFADPDWVETVGR